jgi:hypothetical protein
MNLLFPKKHRSISPLGQGKRVSLQEIRTGTLAQIGCLIILVQKRFCRGVGVSFKMRKRRVTGNDSARRGQRRRAARLHQSFPCITLHGYSREALRPPHPSPKAEHRAATSSFLYFERDPHTPGQANWKTVNLNSRQIWASCKNGYLCNYRARFKPFLASNAPLP